MTLRLFISYAHKDADLKQQLLTHLKGLERQGRIRPWEDTQIEVGSSWREAIGDAMAQCDIALFLISKDFIASDFIHSVEVERLMERREKQGIRVVPIVLRPCVWSLERYGAIEALPAKAKPLVTFAEDDGSRDQAWTDIVVQLDEWAEAIPERNRGPIWKDNPYPGLRAFDEREARIFTGREDKARELLGKLEQGVRMLAVYGASGSGKSSLVRAGLIPAWRQRFPNDEDLPVLILKPDEDADRNPFTPLSMALQPWLETGTDRAMLKRSLFEQPQSIAVHINRALGPLSDATELLLVIDQFEELFNLVKGKYRQPFVRLLLEVAGHARARVVITVRSDFFHRFEDYPDLTDRLNQEGGRYHVLPLAAEHYRALIEQPARLAGFRFEDGLVDRLLEDAQQGASLGGLVPLLEFALAKLYEPFGQQAADGENVQPEDRHFSNAAYDAFDGIKGAVAAAANEAVEAVPDAARALPRLFRTLVSISADQTSTPGELKPTRARAARAELERDPACAALVQRLVGDQHHARLLVASEHHVEVAHEILFDAWQAMADWIAEFQHDLQVRDRMRYEARQWDAGGRSDPHLLWVHERQQPLYEALERLKQPLESWTKEEPEKSFLRPERERLHDEIADPSTNHQRRDWIGARWAAIGDPRRGVGLDPETSLPDIVWSDEVPPGTVELEDGAGRFEIDHPFKVSVHPVTRDQYSAFLDDIDGYDNDTWWRGLTRPEPRWPPTGAGGNYPVGLVSWHEAVAYCSWLDQRLPKPGGQQIRLPTEWEWQLAATGGDRREYPWEGAWDPAKLNSVDSSLMRTTAAGLYPAGAAPCRALDMAGNSWEWCLNKYQDAADTTIGGEAERVLRGGAWIYGQDDCRAAYRSWLNPVSRDGGIGFRLCLSSPIVAD